MPRGIPNKKTDEVTAPAEQPMQIVIIQPTGTGAAHLVAAGMELGQVLETLRMTLVHLAAKQAGVISIIDEEISREIVAFSPKLVATAMTHSSNGPRPTGSRKPPQLAIERHAGQEMDL